MSKRKADSLYGENDIPLNTEEYDEKKLKTESGTPKRVAVSKKSVGGHIKDMFDTPIQICNSLRALLFNESMGHQFPFEYVQDNLNKKWKLKLLSDRPFNGKDVKTELILKKGYVKTEENIRYQEHVSKKKKEKFVTTVPYISEKVGGKTSQGKVFMSTVSVGTANIPLVVKIDGVLPKKNLWFTDSIEHCKGIRGSFRFISDSFMDAMCSILASNLVEQRISPHFPLCYSTNVSLVRYKEPVKRAKDNIAAPKTKTQGQIIWMEKLPFSMHKVLKNESNVMVWFSAFIQLFTALAVFRNKYGFIHNDLHCANVRVRQVDMNSIIYYKTEDGTVLKVPTFGYIFVIIDFGRSLIFPYGPTKEGVVSTEFARGGNCYGSVCDNATIDVVRLINSIEDLTDVIPKNKRGDLRKFFQAMCVTDDGKRDLLAEWNDPKNHKKIVALLDTEPRKICTKKTVFDGIVYLYKYFSAASVPRDIEPLYVPLSIPGTK